MPCKSPAGAYLDRVLGALWGGGALNRGVGVEPPTRPVLTVPLERFPHGPQKKGSNECVHVASHQISVPGPQRTGKPLVGRGSVQDLRREPPRGVHKQGVLPVRVRQEGGEAPQHRSPLRPGRGRGGLGGGMVGGGRCKRGRGGTCVVRISTHGKLKASFVHQGGGTLWDSKW